MRALSRPWLVVFFVCPLGPPPLVGPPPPSFLCVSLGCSPMVQRIWSNGYGPTASGGGGCNARVTGTRRRTRRRRPRTSSRSGALPASTSGDHPARPAASRHPLLGCRDWRKSRNKYLIFCAVVRQRGALRRGPFRRSGFPRHVSRDHALQRAEHVGTFGGMWAGTKRSRAGHVSRGLGRTFQRPQAPRRRATSHRTVQCAPRGRLFALETDIACLAQVSRRQSNSKTQKRICSYFFAALRAGWVPETPLFEL